MKPIKVAVLLISILSMVACGASHEENVFSSEPKVSQSSSSSSKKPSSSSSSQKPSSNSSAQHSSSASSSQSTTPSGMIGPSGGEVKDANNNVSIAIPAGALSQNTPITASYIETPEQLSNEIASDFLGAVEFGPSGIVFNTPVTVTIDLVKEPKSATMAVFCYYAAENVWEYVTDASPAGQKAVFQVTHFSKYQVMDRTNDFLNEYTNIVKHAQTNGLSDAEITSAFRDYLVNEKHVMDQYTTYNGYWYEPCGLKINGNYKLNKKEGDPNALIHSEGDSNKVGNTYGLCQIDGATSSRQNKINANENSEIIDVLVIVEYKIITPDINLTASKKKLNKGESATITVRCHYTNVSNYYQEYKDLALSGYMLTVKRASYFSISNTSLLTDSEGYASFVVTANENGKAETITVNFDVSGDFGTHAEGNVTLNSSGGYQIEGSVIEQYSVTYGPGTIPFGTLTISSVGKIDITIAYEFEATLEEGDNGLQGSLDISNVTMNSVSQKLLYTVAVDEEGTMVYYDYDIDFFAIKNQPVINGASVDVVASENLNGTYSLLGTGVENIALQTGVAELYDTIRIPSISYVDECEDEGFDFKIEVNTSDMLSLPFDLTAGTNTYTESTNLDEISLYGIIDGVGYPMDESGGQVFSSPEKTISQTISISQI